MPQPTEPSLARSMTGAGKGTFERLAERLAGPAHQPDVPACGSDLSAMLDRLLAACGCRKIAPLALEPDLPSRREMLQNLATGFARLGERGDGRFSGLCSIDAPAGGWAGRQGLNAPPAGHGPDPSGHMLLLAPDLRPPLIYRWGRSPIRAPVIDMVDAATGAPYLVLMAYRLDVTAQPVMLAACARPVHSAQRPVPVRSRLDRDVVTCLEHLQLALDIHGVDLSIRCRAAAGMAECSLMQLTLTDPAGTIRTLRILVDGSPASERAGTRPARLSGSHAGASGRFIVTRANWKDGSFSRWLEEQIKG